MRVDTPTGNRTVIADAVIGSGLVVSPDSIAASATGSLFVVGSGRLFQRWTPTLACAVWLVSLGSLA